MIERQLWLFGRHSVCQTVQQPHWIWDDVMIGWILPTGYDPLDKAPNQLDGVYALYTLRVQLRVHTSFMKRFVCSGDRPNSPTHHGHCARERLHTKAPNHRRLANQKCLPSGASWPANRSDRHTRADHYGDHQKELRFAEWTAYKAEQCLSEREAERVLERDWERLRLLESVRQRKARSAADISHEKCLSQELADRVKWLLSKVHSMPAKGGN